MPISKNYFVFKPVKSITAFLTLNAGVIRGETMDPERTLAEAEREKNARGHAKRPGTGANRSARAEKPTAEQEVQIEEQRENLRLAWDRIADQKQQLNRWRAAVQEKDMRIALLEEKLLANGSGDAQSSDVDPAQIVWMFGMIQTGSPWLGAMLGELEGNAVWDEPKMGELFGRFFYDEAPQHRNGEDFVMASERKGTWLRSIRTFVLDATEAKYPLLVEGGHLVVREPSGSIGAPLLAEALPESRMIFLIRNPRDVVASALEAAREGGRAQKAEGNALWREEAAGGLDEHRTGRNDHHQDDRVEKLARMYLQYAGNARKAYEEHPGPKALIRYEDLQADPLGGVKRVCSELGITVDEKKLAAVVKRHSRGQEKGNTDRWREELTAEQVGIVEGITAPLREDLYPDVS